MTRYLVTEKQRALLTAMRDQGLTLTEDLGRVELNGEPIGFRPARDALSGLEHRKVPMVRFVLGSGWGLTTAGREAIQ